MGSLLRFPTVSADFSSHLLGLLRTKRRRSWWAFVDERWTFLLKVFLLLMLFVVNVMETRQVALLRTRRGRIEIFFSFKWMCFFVVKIEKQLLSLLSNLLHLSSSLFSVSNFSLSLSLSSPSLHPLFTLSMYINEWSVSSSTSSKKKLLRVNFKQCKI
jgi:hypothetical protein